MMAPLTSVLVRTSSLFDALYTFSHPITIPPKNQDTGETYDRDDARLLRHMLRAPGEVARLEAERAELGVPAARAHSVDTLRAELGVGGLAAELELALLAVVRALGAGRGPLVSRCARDTCGEALVVDGGDDDDDVPISCGVFWKGRNACGFKARR